MSPSSEPAREAAGEPLLTADLPVDAPRAGAAGSMRVLTFLSVLAIGGSERQAIILSEGLKDLGADLHLGCCTRTGDNIEHALTARGVPITQYPITSLYGAGTVRQQVRLARYLRQARIDVVHSYNFYANVFAVPAARMAGVPVVVASIRDNGQGWTIWQRRVERMVCRMADCVLVNADIIRRRLAAEGYDGRRIRVIHNGIVPIPPPRADHAALRRDLSLPQDAPIVGVVARLDRIKGLEFFLEAAVLTAARHPDVRFLIVGDTHANTGGYREQLKRLAASLGVADLVRFTGFRLDVPDLLSMFAVSVLPSLSEGLSNTLLESMAAGLPVVATAVGGTPEIVEDGVTGILIPPKDPQAMADAVCRLLDQPELAARMGRAGRDRIAGRFSNERMVSETVSLYRDLLSAKHRPAVRV